MTNLYPFTVRVETGQQCYPYVKSAEAAARYAEERFKSPAVLVQRADEPSVRHRKSWVGRILERLL